MSATFPGIWVALVVAPILQMSLAHCG